MAGFASMIGMALGSAAMPAAAQALPPAPEQLAPVTVSGDRHGDYKVDRGSSPKLTAPLLDTPQTITIIPQTVIKEQGARSLTDVLRNTPGISFNAGENGFSTSTNNFSLRGFDTSGSIFIDGSRDSGSYTRDMFNVDRVEVFKGPAADNGRGTPGGYINIVTKSPERRNFAAGDIAFGFDEYGTEWRKRATVDVNRMITDQTAARLNVMLEDSGVPGRDVAKDKSFGVAPSLAFGLGTDFRAFLSYEYVKQDDRPDWGVPGAMVKGLRTFNPTTRGADRDNFYGLKSDYDRTDYQALLARFEFDVADNVTISNQTRWARVDRDARYTVPTGYTQATRQVSTQMQFYERVNSTVTNLTNVAVDFKTGALDHTLSAGLELTREWSDGRRFPTNNPGSTSIFDPDDGRFGAFSPSAAERNKVRVDTAALYAYDTVKLGPQWELTGGLRLEWYRVKIDSRTAAGASTGGLDGYDESKLSLGGKLGVVYKPVENGSLYAAFAVAALPPGSYLSNPDISRTGDNAFPGFVNGAKGITSYNYEIGVKWNFFNGRLSTNAALFRTDKTGVPISGRDVGETVDSLKGYGRQTVQGIEVGVAGEITPEWKVFGGFALMDSKRKHSAYLDEVRRRANHGDYGSVSRTDGDELAFTPQFTGSLWTTYRFPFGLTVGGGVQHVGASWLGRPDDALRIIPNGAFGKLPAYTLFHAMLAYEVTENITVRLNVDNIFNKQYAVSTNWNGSRATLGAPRTFMITTGFRF
ncbi:TonB-dependent receptor [Vineibacter terrae]|nr:TonB-dependent siderophore receptor [Vineibacter terrae]